MDFNTISAIAMEGPAADARWMGHALRQAEQAARQGEVPIGAVVVCNGRIVGEGHNMTEALGDVTAHAEMLAITAAAQTMGGKYLTDCTLYVTVEPCLMCSGAITWSQLRRIVIGAPDPKRGYSAYVCRRPFHPKAEVVTGVRADECADIVREFFKKRR